MRDYLLFRLYGPMAAWGDIAVGEYRPSYAQPSKSAVVGLLAAALGIRRDEEEQQNALASSCEFAVRVDAMGALLRDYHTTQVPSAQKGVTHYTRRSELAMNDLNTILSSRDYRCDAVFTIGLTLSADAPCTIQQLALAMNKPVFTLYLGRKSCPLALPLSPQIIRAATLHDALLAFPDADELQDIISHADVNVFWEGDNESGFAIQQVIGRRDTPRSRRRWQFSDRRENCSIWRKEG